MKKIDDMNYKEFFGYCNDRACDGQWGVVKAINCINIIEHIEGIKVPGILGCFRKRKLEKLKEDEWQKIKSKIIEKVNSDK